MAGTQKQVCDIRGGKGMTIAQSNEHLRVGAQNAYTKKVAGTMDLTRDKLNFEIGRGGMVKEVDKKNSIPKRIKLNLRERGIIDPNIGLEEPTRLTVANIIIGGSTERMRELAFGDQQVNYERGADNSHIVRQPAIEQWAVDMYNFMAKKYGEQNIAAFVVHLDETNPHIHCTLLPITEKNKFSYRTLFGGSKEEGSQKFLTLHNELAEVNKKYGLARGESVLKTNAQHKSYKQWLEERISADSQTLTSLREQLNLLNTEIKKAERKLKGLTTMLANKTTERAALLASIEKLTSGATDVQTQSEESKRAADAKIVAQRAELQLADEKIALRTQQLDLAREQLTELLNKQATVQKNIEELLHHLNKATPQAQEQAAEEIKAAGWDVVTEEAMSMRDRLNEFGDRLSPEQRDELNDIFENSFFGTMADKGNEVVSVSSNLVLGLLQAAIAEASKGGGGGSHPGSGWGRKKDEDDLDFRRRCIMMGANMLQRGSEGIAPTKKKRGIRR